MLLTPEQSSMFSAIDYHPASRTLTVKYRSGGKEYVHNDVPVDLGERLLAAVSDPEQSVGKMFHKEVKKQYPGVAVPVPPEREMPPEYKEEP